MLRVPQTATFLPSFQRSCRVSFSFRLIFYDFTDPVKTRRVNTISPVASALLHTCTFCPAWHLYLPHNIFTSLHSVLQSSLRTFPLPSTFHHQFLLPTILQLFKCLPNSPKDDYKASINKRKYQNKHVKANRGRIKTNVLTHNISISAITQALYEEKEIYIHTFVCLVDNKLRMTKVNVKISCNKQWRPIGL